MIQGRDLLKVVDVLNQVETEAALRTQVGRLYYAVFLEVRSWCETNLGYSRVQMAREHQALATSVGSCRLGDLSLGSADFPTKVVILTEGKDPPAKPVRKADIVLGSP